METIFITGSHGIVGRELVRSVARACTGRARIVLLLRGDALEVRAKLMRVRSHVGDARCEINAVPGDVTSPRLGIDEGTYEQLTRDVTMILHAAADTGFRQSREDAGRVNVKGTAHVLELARLCVHNPRFGYLGTAFVAGGRTGEIAEDACGVEGPFFTEYERSKAYAEALVRDASRSLPVSILRLGIVVGRQTDGVIGTFDGPYRVFKLAQHGLLAMLPGDPSQPVDFVPVDFAADAITWLMRDGFRAGETFHVCAGPHRSLPLGAIMPLVMARFAALDPAFRAHGYPAPVVVTPEVFRDFVDTIEQVGNPRLRSVLENVQTFTRHLSAPKRFSTARLDRALEGSGLSLQHARDFLPTLVDHAVRARFEVSA
jgi:nucleoside-diphosphate-sugar epimerase